MSDFFILIQNHPLVNVSCDNYNTNSNNHNDNNNYSNSSDNKSASILNYMKESG